MLKHNAASQAIKIVEMHDGIDFQFKTKGHGNRISEFIQSHVPTKVALSRELISTDEKNGTATYKFTSSLEIAKICKDDLVLLPKSLSKELGGIGPLVLVFKVSTMIHIVDVKTMETKEMDSNTYWKYEFGALCSRS